MSDVFLTTFHNPKNCAFCCVKCLFTWQIPQKSPPEHLSFTISVLILKSLDITNHGLLQFLQVAKIG